MLLSRPLSHQSKLEYIVILFFIKAKYIATCKARKEALWVSQFLAILSFQLLILLVDLYVDNKGAISLTKNPQFYQKTKYIKVL